MKDLRKLVEEWFDKNSTNYKWSRSRHHTISMIVDFYKQTSKDMYPKEFIEWACKGLLIIKGDHEMTMEGAYKFWKDNIQGKKNNSNI